MTSESRIARNAAALSVGRIIGETFTFFFLALFGRVFGQAALGTYAFAMAVGGLTSVFVGLGLNTFTVRRISRRPELGPTTLGQILVLRTVLAVLLFGLLLSAGALGLFGRDTLWVVLIIGAQHVILKIRGTVEAGFQARQQMVYPSLLLIGQKGMILVLGSFLIAAGAQPVAVLTVYPAAALVTLVAGVMAYTARFGRLKIAPDLAFWKDAVRQAGPFFMIVLLAQFYDRIGVIVLTTTKGAAATGIFMASDRFLVTVGGLLATLTTALFPPMVDAMGRGRGELDGLCEWALRLKMAFVVPLATVLFLLAEPIMVLAFGAGFTASGRVMRIAVWSLLLVNVNQLFAQTLIVADRQRQLVVLRLGAYALYVALVLVLVRHFSYLGLAAAKLITEGILGVMTVQAARRATAAGSILKGFAAPLGLCLGCLAVIDGAAGVPVGLKVLVQAVFCALVIRLFGCVRASDLRFLRTMWLRRG